VLLMMTTAISPGPSPQRRARLARRIRLLVAATITYNVIEAVVALAEGTRVSSSALIGFGLDSVIEVASAMSRVDVPKYPRWANNSDASSRMRPLVEDQSTAGGCQPCPYFTG
jgi:hypothetical protein